MEEDEFLTSQLSRKHQGVVSEESCDDVCGNLIALIVLMGGQTSKVLEKQHDVQGDLEVARNNQFRQLKQSKRRIMDSIEIAYQELEWLFNSAYFDVEGDNDIASVVDGSASNFPDVPKCARLLDKLTGTLRERLMFLSAELDAASTFLDNVIKTENKPNYLQAVLEELQTISLPLSASTCLPSMVDQPNLHVSITTSSSAIQLPGVSVALALLNDKIFLLADLESGMSEVCSESGCKLSRWLPPLYDLEEEEEEKDDYCNEFDPKDAVVAVLTLSDRRVAVALEKKDVIVLLRRCKKSALEFNLYDKSELTWTEYRRLVPVGFSPEMMSSHGDVLAAASILDREIQLLSIRCGRRLGPSIITEYEIKSLAVCSNAVITGSGDKVELDGGRHAYVIDAYSLTSHGERLWHRELSSDEELRALCTDSMRGYLYAAIWASDGCSGLVASFSLTNFSELRRIVLSLDEAPQSPLVLSALSVWNDAAADQQQLVKQENGATVSRPMLLAVLYSDPEKCVKSTVTIHRFAAA